MEQEYGLAKSERLSSLAAVRRLFSDGTAGFVYPFRYTYFADRSTTPSGVEVLFSVPKRFHKRANRRNLLRRRTKEAYRLSKRALLDAVEQKGVALDLSLVYSTKDVLPYKTIENAVRKILAELVERV